MSDNKKCSNCNTTSITVKSYGNSVDGTQVLLCDECLKLVVTPPITETKQ